MPSVAINVVVVVVRNALVRLANNYRSLHCPTRLTLLAACTISLLTP